MDQPEETILEGFISVEAALKAESRPLHRILVRRDKVGGRRPDRALAWLTRTATSAGVPVELTDAAALDEMTQGSSHGGVVAVAGPRRMVAMADLVENRTAPFIVMLDGIEDPFNFGYSLRALYAAGVDGLVVRPRNWMSAAGTVARSSAGASEWVPTAVAETAEEAAAFFRQRGLTVACAAKDDRAVPLFTAELSGPLFLLVGGEKRGITRSFMDQADLLLEIPYGREFRQSLGTTSAASVLGFEILRQRSAMSKE
jgi:23S rRNA (guanosine2251-2'-O)-methyltransferase